MIGPPLGLPQSPLWLTGSVRLVAIALLNLLDGEINVECSTLIDDTLHYDFAVEFIDNLLGSRQAQPGPSVPF